MKLGTENRKQTIAAIVLAAVLVLVIAYEVIPSFSTNASTSLAATTTIPATALEPCQIRDASRRTVFLTEKRAGSAEP